MTDLCLWLLLVLAVVSNLLHIAGHGEPSGEQVRKQMSSGLFWTSGTVGMVLVGLWIWLAVLTGHWQFAALAAQGPIIRFAAGLGGPR